MPYIRARLEADTALLGASFAAMPPTKTRPKPGLVVSISTDPIDNQGSFEQQEVSIVAGMLGASKLRRRLIENQSVPGSGCIDFVAQVWFTGCKTER